MSETSSYVLDSYALLAYLENERGGGRVFAILEQAERGENQVFMSIINLGEVAYITEREQGLQRVQETLSMVQKLPLQIMPATQEIVFHAAHIKAFHRLSYADAFAVAAANLYGGILITGDPEFKSVQSEIRIEWLSK